MYSLKVQRYLSLLRLLDVMSAEPVVQLEYLRLQNAPDPVTAMSDFFEDLDGYASLFEELLDEGDINASEFGLFNRLQGMSESIDAERDAYTRQKIFYGNQWREVRDTALLLKLSLSSRSILKPELRS